MDIDFVEAGAYFAFAGSFLYIAGYTLLAPWWRNLASRGMVAFSFANMVLLLPVVLHLLTGLTIANHWYLVYYASSLFLCGGVEFWRLWVVYHIQQHDTPHGRRRKGGE